MVRYHHTLCIFLDFYYILARSQELFFLLRFVVLLTYLKPFYLSLFFLKRLSKLWHIYNCKTSYELFLSSLCSK